MNSLIANKEVTKLLNGNIQTISIFYGYPVRAIFDQVSQQNVVVGKDTGIALGYSNFRQAISYNVAPEDKGVYSVAPLNKNRISGGIQSAVGINESGLNALILHSRKPKAKKFKRFITKSVIPEIMNTGKYEKRDNNELKNIFGSMFDNNEAKEPEQLSLNEAPNITVNTGKLLSLAEIAKKQRNQAVYEDLLSRAIKQL